MSFSSKKEKDEKVMNIQNKKEKITSMTPQPTPQVYEMISGIGKTKSEIMESIPGVNEKAITVMWKIRYHETRKKGTVIAQSVPAKTKYSKENKINVTFTLSKGAKKVTVPSVVGMNYKTAEKKIKAKGFTCKITWKETQSVQNQAVISQNVKAGTKKRKKACITLLVSKKVEQKTPKPKKKTKNYDGVITY